MAILALAYIEVHWNGLDQMALAFETFMHINKHGVKDIYLDEPCS